MPHFSEFSFSIEPSNFSSSSGEASLNRTIITEKNRMALLDAYSTALPHLTPSFLQGYSSVAPNDSKIRTTRTEASMTSSNSLNSSRFEQVKALRRQQEESVLSILHQRLSSLKGHEHKLKQVLKFKAVKSQLKDKARNSQNPESDIQAHLQTQTREKIRKVMKTRQIGMAKLR